VTITESTPHIHGVEPTAELVTEQLGTNDLNPRAFRDTLGHYASSITIVSGVNEGALVGFTCQSFYSVSLEPPLVSFSVAVTSTSYPLIRESGKFCVNVLAEDQHSVSSQFARSGSDKWAGIDYALSDLDNPVIAGTTMWVDCTLEAEYLAGDHYIVVGRVQSMSPVEWHQAAPLLYFKGAYRQLSTPAE